MYQILCDGKPIYDPRDEDLILLNPKCNLGANSVGEGSFTILSTHPEYGSLKKLKSIFEVRQDSSVIFRGRMTNDSKDLYNRMDVDLEGVLGFTNDTVIPPFTYKDKIISWEDKKATCTNNEVVKFFLQWILDRHNEQAEPWQRLKLGDVVGFEATNNIERYDDKYTPTWEILKTRLFESNLGGYLIIRYEEDGNYVDYLSEFESAASQEITFGENLMDITHATDANETYTAIIPFGKETDIETGSDYEGSYVTITNTVKEKVSLKDLPDGYLTEDLYKKGLFVYSKSAVEQYGWICAPVDNTTWDDIITVAGLAEKAIEYLSETAMKLSDTISITALDLSFTDEQIQSFRINQNVVVNSPIHGISNVSYPLTRLEIDILNPQNTKITLGETKRVLTDQANQASKNVNEVKKSNSHTNIDLIEIGKSLDDKVGRTENDQVVSMINNADDTVELDGRLSVKSDYFGLDEQGRITAKNGRIASWDISETALSQKPVPVLREAELDERGEWIINDEGVPQYVGSGGTHTAASFDNLGIGFRAKSPSPNDPLLAIGYKGWWADAPFRVYSNGRMVASNATIKGRIEADEGYIGNCALSGGTLKLKDGMINDIVRINNRGLISEIPYGTPQAITVNLLSTLSAGGRFVVDVSENSGNGGALFDIYYKISDTNHLVYSVEEAGIYVINLPAAPPGGYYINSFLSDPDYNYQAGTYTIYTERGYYDAFIGWGACAVRNQNDIAFYAGSCYDDRANANFRIHNNGNVYLRHSFSVWDGSSTIERSELTDVLDAICRALDELKG